MSIAFPTPDPAILARRDEILRGLAPLVASEALIASEDERRAFETDGLTAYRRVPLAVVLPSTTAEVSAVMRFCHANGVKVVPRGAGTSLSGGAHRPGGRDHPRRRQDEPRARHRFREPHRAGAVRPHQSRHHRARSPMRASSTPPTRPPARLHHRRQHRDELGRRALPEVRRDHQQPPRRHAWC